MNNNQFNKSMQTIKNYVDEKIPTKTSQLQNDSDFATNASVDQKIADVNGANNESLAAYIESTYGNNLVVDADRPSSFINKDGSTVNGPFTNYIPMKKGESYISNQSYTQYHFFDSEKNHISTLTFLSNPQIFVPGVDGYLLITTSDINNAIVLEGTDLEALRETEYKLQRAKVQPMSKWYGKKWLCIGDSISTDAAGLASVGYAKLISRELGMTVTNVAVSGKTMSYFYNLIDNYPENYDLITVMLGANNHGYHCAIGQLNDDVYKAGTYDSNNSFFAQAQLLYEKLRVKYPKSVIMFIGLIKRWTPDEAKNNADGFMINAVQKTTEAYSNALREMCNWYSIPFVDVYNTIDPRSLINRQTFFCSETDGTHPNDLGHALFIAPIIRDAIIKHEPYFFNDWTANIIYGNIQVNTNTLALNEGASGSINVKLDKAPTNNQTVNITSNNADVTVSPSSLTFTPDNFDTEQVVTINVAEDNEDYADESATLTLSSIRVPNVTVSISITDNDEQPAQPTLTSISATYTQGSKVVYPDTSLDTLKTDLVVKANYSDSTQQTVTDYSLNGNLTEGTSTITVTYQDKTTTFNVTVSAKEQQPTEPTDLKTLIYDFTTLNVDNTSISSTGTEAFDITLPTATASGYLDVGVNNISANHNPSAIDFLNNSNFTIISKYQAENAGVYPYLLSTCSRRVDNGYSAYIDDGVTSIIDFNMAMAPTDGFYQERYLKVTEYFHDTEDHKVNYYVNGVTDKNVTIPFDANEHTIAITYNNTSKQVKVYVDGVYKDYVDLSELLNPITWTGLAFGIDGMHYYNLYISNQCGTDEETINLMNNVFIPSTEPSEPEPQTGLIHKWLSPDTAVEDAEYNNYPTLQDQVGQLDLTSSQYWREGTAKNSFTTEEYFVINKLGEDIWDMPDGMSFSVKINKYTRLGRYFSELALLHTGALNGINIPTDNWVGYNGDFSRFTLTIASAASSAFGDGVIGLIYKGTDGDVTIKGDPELGMINTNTTADILITFNGETNVIQIYQDTTKVAEAVAERPLRIDGIINLAANNSNTQTYESIEIYNKVITPTE